MQWLLLFGIATGMRTMTPIAVMCWFACLGLLPQTGWAGWSGHWVSAIMFTVFALGEYYGDTLPQTPSRTDAMPLVARVVFGAVATALLARSTGGPAAGGVVFGAIGALMGAYGFRWLRAWGAKTAGSDLPVALSESALALGIALWVAFTFHSYHLLLVRAD
jgi:uncharacterized membrane protein